jgi:Ca2+-binding EF-hand superfamily protein
VKDNPGARKLSADFIGRLFKYFPEEGERSIQALAQLCVDSDAAVRNSTKKTFTAAFKFYKT